jgi:prepilin-type N-terminal cleavage/methylation domain-containing protein
MKKEYSYSSGFTLMEMLIVMAILTVIALVVILGLNPLGQISKAHDAKRKSDLSTIKKVFEDYYNDKSCYPPPSAVCFDGSGNTSPCTICGAQANSPSFSPYLNQLPCDPTNNTSKKYLYEVDNTTCATSFKIYTKLENMTDNSIAETGCQNGCGPISSYDNNYGVSSPNTDLERGAAPGLTATPTPGDRYVCCSVNTPSTCNTCGAYADCMASPGCRHDRVYSVASNPDCSGSPSVICR